MLCQFLLYTKVNQLYTYNILKFYSHISHYRVLSRVSCAMQQFLLIIYFIYSSVYMSISVCQFILPSLPHEFFYTYDLIFFSFSHLFFDFCFLNRLICNIILDSTCKPYHMIFLFLCLISFTQYVSLQVHPCCYKWFCSL